ncbi:MAG TPA: c-type cytochrome [Pusillimonas sp.]
MYSRFFFVLFCLVGVGSFSPTYAQQPVGPDLAKASNCMACHQVDKKRVGPAFKVIAERFAGQAGAGDYLAGAIRSGGRGRWGAVPMPAQPQVSPADAKLLAAWILSLADDKSAITQ